MAALAGLAKTKRFHTTIDIGDKYAEKQTRCFDEGKLKAGQSVISLQMGTNKCASQAGMTAYGTRRHLYDPKMQTDKPFDQTTISLQMGTNKGASQVSDTLIILVSESTKGPFKFTLNLILTNRVQSGYFCAIYIEYTP